jgi:hypothetical protein
VKALSKFDFPDAFAPYSAAVFKANGLLSIETLLSCHTDSAPETKLNVAFSLNDLKFSTEN